MQFLIKPCFHPSIKQLLKQLKISVVVRLKFLKKHLVVIIVYLDYFHCGWFMTNIINAEAASQKHRMASLYSPRPSLFQILALTCLVRVHDGVPEER